MLLQNKTALITGTNRGIGKAMIEAFAANGANIYAHARKETPEFILYINSVSKQYGVEIVPIYFDMIDTDIMKTEINKLIKSKINIDILINNAGIAHGGLFTMTKIQTIREIFDINLFVHMELTQLIIRQMMKNKSGCIINMSSISGFDLKAGNSAYGVSKAAISAWTKTLAAEMGKYGIRINAIAPSLTDTDMASLMQKDASISMVQSSAMKRMAKPEEIADVAVFLSSDKSSFINGEVIRVDGGKE